MKTMKHLSKRGLALILALMMFVSVLPMQAFAAVTTDPVTGAVSDDYVTINKTARRTGADTWDVTMTVTPKAEALKPQPLELVLLLDTSYSMRWCTRSDGHEHISKGENACEFHYDGIRKVYDCGYHTHNANSACDYVGTGEGQTESRLTIAKREASKLVTDLAGKGLDVKVSLAWFNGSSKVTKTRLSLDDPKNVTELTTAISNLSMGSSTYMNNALNTAKGAFTANTGTKKVLVMLSDGEDNGGGNITGTANTIKAYADIYTIGFTIDNPTLKAIASEGRYYNANNDTELAKVFESIKTRMTAMVEDNMGKHVNVQGEVAVTGNEAGAVVPETKDSMTWNPENGAEVSNEVKFTYTVKANPSQLNAGEQTINLNGDAYLKYTVGNDPQELKFPIPTDTVDVRTLTEKWVEVGGSADLQDPVTTKKIYWNEASDNGNFAVAQPDATINSNLNYQYSVVDGSANGTKLTEGATVANDGQNHTIIHYYSATPVEPPEDTTGNTVTYRFVSNDSTSLPVEVTAKLTQPDNSTYKVNASVENKLKSTEYTPVTETLADYSTRTWTFTSWDADSKTMAKGGITFTGTWTHIDTPHEHKYDTTSVGHDGDGYVVTTPANCVDTGTKTRTCTVCNETETATIPVDSNNHKTPQTEFHDTCTTGCSQGSSDHHERICTSCTKVLESAPHSYTNEHKDASYTEAGYDRYTCECGHHYEETISQLQYGQGSYVIKWVDEDGNPLKENQNVTVDDIEGTSKEVTVNVGETTITKGDFTYTLDGRESLTGTVTAGAVATEFVFHFKRNNTTLSVEKTTKQTTAKVGETIEYTITVTNSGDYKAANVVVEEKPSRSLSIQKVTMGGQLINPEDNGKYLVGNINSHESVELIVTAEVVGAPAEDEGNKIVNVAVATLENGDPTQGGTGTEPGTDNPGGDEGKDDTVKFQVTLTYDSNKPTDATAEVSNVPDGQTVEKGQQATVSSQKPTLDGYNFKGWNTKYDGTGTAYAAGAPITLNENTTLYAVWEKKATVITDPEKPGPKPVDPGDTIIVNPNGGTWSPAEGEKNEWTEDTDTKTWRNDAEEGETITIPVPTWDGHTFIEWEVDGPKEIGGKVTITYTAKWSIPATQVKMPYKVERYFETVNGDTHSYVINATETETKHDFVGQEVEATPKTYPGFVEDSSVEGTLTTGKVKTPTPIKDADDNVTGVDILTLKVYYSIDKVVDPNVKPTVDPENPPKSDGIPDKYQVTVEYVSANQTQGTVTGDVEKVITLYADDEDHSKGYVSEKAITPNTDDVTTTANTGYEANGWNPDPTQPLNVKGGQTYTYTAQWKAVEPSPSPSTTPSNPGGGNGGGGTDPTPAPRYTVNWEDGDGNIIKTATVTGTTVPDSLYPADPEKEGSSFLGWGEPDIVGNVITIIAEWEEEFDPNDVPLIVAPGLDSTDHFAYIIGYGDGTVRPTRNITRAEVATIFYRLMTDDYRGTFWCQTNDFTDVNPGDWFNNAVSTSSEAELVKGYADGTFKGKNNITRAEFATIAARFLSDDPTGENPFTDIGSHWAKNDILKAYEAGWINGYADGTFKPNALITRAEAMTIVNRMLNRVPHAEDLLDGEMTTYPDNQPGAWYYAAVQEATNSHDYEMGDRDGQTVETWTNMKANRDWAALEKEWSDAYSGSNGNDVM